MEFADPGGRDSYCSPLEMGPRNGAVYMTKAIQGGGVKTRRTVLVIASLGVLVLFLTTACSSPLEVPDSDPEDGTDQTTGDDTSGNDQDGTGDDSNPGNDPNGGDDTDGTDPGDTNDPGGGSADTTPPEPVTGLTAEADNGNVVLSWTNPPDSDLAETRVTWEPDGSTPRSVTPPEAGYTVTGLTNGTPYTFTVVAVDDAGNVSSAEHVTATPTEPPVAVPAPSNLEVYPGDAQFMVTWTDPPAATGDESEASEIRVLINGATQFEVPLALGEESARFTGQTNGQEVEVTVRAVDAEGNLSDSVTATATPGPVGAPDLDPANDTGVSDADGITGHAGTLTIRGQTPGSGLDVWVYDDGTLVHQTQSDDQGAWEYQNDLPEGTHELYAELRGPGGFVIGTSPTATFVVDETAPASAPRLLRPRTGYNTGTDLTPRFMWESVPDADYVELQASTDPGFLTPEYTWSYLTGDSFEPDEQMDAATTVPVGTRYYLRIRAVDDAGNASDWSNTGTGPPHRYVNIGRFDGDVNGDGYSDVVVGAYYYEENNSNPGRVYIFYGDSPGGMDTTADVTITGEGVGTANDGHFGLGVAVAGDVDGDGFADIVVGAPYLEDGSNSRAGRAYLFRGGINVGAALSASDADLEIATPFTSGSGLDRFGARVASAGDVNADGYTDFLVGAYTASDRNAGSSVVGLALYLGGDTTSLSGTEGESWTFSNVREIKDNQVGDEKNIYSIDVSSAGDLNGDGFGDFVFGMPTTDNGGTVQAGQAVAFLGIEDVGTLGLETVDFRGTAANTYLGVNVAGGGDFNGDGYDDLLLGTGLERAEIHYGRAAFESGAAGTSTLEGDQDGSKFGETVAPLGDFSGDGVDDLVVGARRYQFNYAGRGRAYVKHGPVEIGSAVTSYSRIANGSGFEVYFGRTLGSAGDVDGDGRYDMIVGEWNNVGGRVQLFWGRDEPIASDLTFAGVGAGDTSENFSVGLGRGW